MSLKELVLKLHEDGLSADQIFKKSMEVPLADPRSRLSWNYLQSVLRKHKQEQLNATTRKVAG